ncbi:MAG: histidine--tRNA ligase [Beijerinckiaceae bacterium]|nr:histidine--tRNA ligase [Beijerinckiaceae bacterium]
MSNSGKVAPRLARGFGDRGPAEIAATNAMIEKIKAVYELYGFEAVETPFFEYTEALGKFLPDTDRPNEGVFSLQDDDEQWMSLRYDLTAPLARYVAENFDRLPKPYRSYRAGYVFRNEKPGPGRFRQFMQFDADTVGASSVAADAEICMMAADCMEAVGIKRGDYVIKVNNRKVLDGVMEAIGLGGEENAGRRLTVLRAIDKADKFPVEEIRKLLGVGRWDGGEEGKGDFTKGANLFPWQIDVILELKIESEGTGEQTAVSLPLPDGTSLREKSPLFAEGRDELWEIQALFRASGYGNDRIKIDSSVVRGLEYYTGPVFEAELTFTVPDEKGNPIRFGSVGGGGRYDGLVQRFRDEPVPATGFSVGVSRLQAALSHLEKGKQKHHGPVVVLVMDKEPEAQARYQNFVSRLRSEGIAAEMYLGSAGMNAQLKYADKRNSLVAVIQGSNERAEGKVIVKDLVAGAELASAAKSMEREAYLALKERSQMLVDETALIETVRAVIARHL